MKTKRTLRERKFIKAYIENFGNATKAIMAINPNIKENSARELGSRMLAKVDVSIIEILDDMGLTDPLLSQKLLEGLSATRETGPPFNRREITDYGVIVKYIDMALKLKGKYPSEKHDVKVEGELKITDARQKFIDKVNHIIARTGENETT